MPTAAMFFVLSAFATSAFGAEVPNDFKSGPIDCDTLKNDPQSRYVKMRLNNRSDVPSVERRIDDLRLQFWFTYPDPETPNQQKPGHEKARDDFAQALFEKDVWYLHVNVMRRLSEDMDRDPSSKRGLAILGELIAAKSGGIDGGIRQTARPEFDAWVNATRAALGPIRGPDDIFVLNQEIGKGFLSEVFRQASNPGGKEFQAYVMQRDWAEFDAAGRVPSGYFSREKFGILLYFRRGLLTFDQATKNYGVMTKVLGLKVVEDAAEQVLKYAQRMKTGTKNLVVTARPPLKRTPSGSLVDDDTVPMPEEVIGWVAHPLEAMEILATKDDDRRYLLYLLTGQNRLDSTSLDRPNQWSFAETTYNRLVIAFGEKDLLEAAHVLRTAKKRMTDGAVMDAKAIGATRQQLWASFEDVLARKSPRGYLRSALVFKSNLDSKAAVDAAYQKLVSNGNESDLLETARRMAGGRPNLIFPGELDSLLAALNRPPPPEKPARNIFDYPEYLAWKGFTPGAKVSHLMRVWQLAPTGDRLVPGPVTDGQAFQLQSINPEQAKLWFIQTSFDRSGKARPSRDREESYPAKLIDPPNPDRLTSTQAASLVPKGNHWYVITPSSAPIESGEETVEINGKRIATQWRSLKYSFDPKSEAKDCTLIIKVWTSDAVPSGLVRRTEDRSCPPDRTNPKGIRFVYETYLESFEGSRPGVAAPASK